MRTSETLRGKARRSEGLENLVVITVVKMGFENLEKGRKLKDPLVRT